MWFHEKHARENFAVTANFFFSVYVKWGFISQQLKSDHALQQEWDKSTAYGDREAEKNTERLQNKAGKPLC